MFVTVTLFTTTSVFAQHRPLSRHFVASTRDRYQVTLNIKVESHSVDTETVASQTYVTPTMHTAEINLRWRTIRDILSVQDDGAAVVTETLIPANQQCADMPQPAEEIDTALQSSLKSFCISWMQNEVIRYGESTSGALKEVTPTSGENALAQLDGTSPRLLSLWLKRAVRPNVILPQLPFEVGANSRESFQPGSHLLQNAHGSETIEWLDAPGETPAATLHVVQQLLWNAPPSAAAATNSQSRAPHDESFFADSLSTVSILDGSLLHANRSASRTTVRHVDPVPGLSQPPDFSSKLTLTVTIERLP
jgi:hypothetical protein